MAYREAVPTLHTVSPHRALSFREGSKPRFSTVFNDMDSAEIKTEKFSLEVRVGAVTALSFPESA
jgi:hypothetical protein